MSEPEPHPQPTMVVQIGGIKLTGAAAAIALVVLLSAIVGILFLLHPRFRWSPLWISAALWLGFIIAWSAKAANSSAAKTSETPRSRALHSNLLNLSLLLLFLRLPGLKLRWVPEAMWVTALGLMLHVASMWLAFSARRHLGRHWSHAVTEKVDHELVRSGPYRWVRHPIYTAMLGMYLGTALVSGELHALIAVAIVIAAYVRKIRLEERLLERVFGADFREYRRHSRALIPGVI